MVTIVSGVGFVRILQDPRADVNLATGVARSGVPLASQGVSRKCFARPATGDKFSRRIHNTFSIQRSRARMTATPWPLFHVLVWSILRPVNIVVRDGTHCGEAAYVLTKFTPRAASLRRLGISSLA